MDPSPTAEATRLIEPWRTSPATNTPGTLVSSRSGSRVSRHTSGHLAILAQVRPRQHKSILVAQNARRKPSRDRHRADKNKQRSCRHFRVPRRAAQSQRLQPLVANGLEHLGSRLHHNIGCARNLIDQIFRHGGRKPVSAHQHGYLGGIFGEVEGGLAGGVGAADDINLLALRRRGPQPGPRRSRCRSR